MQQWKKGDVPLASYDSGSWGPDEAHALIARLGHDWSRP
jgi:glucose-6-phosphate 1-dehydrogenase